MKIRIDEIVNTKRPFTPKGKDYTIFEFEVDGEVNGRAERGFVVKTMSERMAKEFRPGWEGEAKEDDYNGNISYRVFAPKDDQRSSGGSGGGGKSSGGQPEDSMKLQCFALSYAKDLVAPMISAGILKDTEQIGVVWGELADRGLTWLRARRNVIDKPAEDWVSLITRNKLEEDVRKLGMTKAALERLWENSGKAPEEFIKNLRGAIAGDDLPF